MEDAATHHTIGITTIADAYHKLLAYGMEREALLKLLGLEKSDVENPDTRVSASCIPLIWNKLIDLSQDEAIGLTIGRTVQPETLSIVAQTVFQSENFLQGIQHYIRFYRVVNESVVVSLQRENGLASLAFDFEPTCRHQSEVERTLCSAVAKARHGLGQHLKPKEVHFRHPKPAYAEQYEAVFRSPIHFSQSQDRIIFSDKLLKEKSPQRNPYLMRALVQHAEDLLSRVQPARSTVSAVRNFIDQNLTQEKLDIELVSKHLHMSRHTLYRKLKADNVSFQSIVDEIKKFKALKLLEEADISLSEVAFMTGFSELSAFCRAFKRWTGQSPASYRKKALNSSPVY